MQARVKLSLQPLLQVACNDSCSLGVAYDNLGGGSFSHSLYFFFQYLDFHVVISSKSWELCFHCLTLVNYYPLMRLTHCCEINQNLLCCSQLSVIMVEDKVITLGSLGPNELSNLAQYIRTTLKGCKKWSHIEENGPPRDDP
ncbi:hypothetical protein CR513_37481, partial [Mucuna pruriens]